MLLAKRLYMQPASRLASDVDLLVAEREVERTKTALQRVGYVASTHPSEERFRREHHHVHLRHPTALPLELHFHAFAGFGTTLRSERLLARKHAVDGYRAIGELSTIDQLVYRFPPCGGLHVGNDLFFALYNFS